MRFLIISHALHKVKETNVFSYAPYVREMNVWLKYVDEVEVVSPLVSEAISEIDKAYKHNDLVLTDIPYIQFTSIKHIVSSLFKIPIILFNIFKACKNADHIHLRCPGNIGLLGCLVQIVFPKKLKTAKYAGNWDPNSKQPLSYKLQKWILSNTFLTKNMHVLVYGDWKNQTKNIKAFFTATYKNSEKEKPVVRDYLGPLKFVFVGSLVTGKRPLFAIQVIEALRKQGKSVFLDMYGDGVLKPELQNYIHANGLDNIVVLHGNQPKDTIKKSFKIAHFSILASKSEGWPKAIAESMFFGVIPIATSTSCVPFMLGFGERGLLINTNIEDVVVKIHDVLKDAKKAESISKKASKWSQEYTLDKFENEIVKLLKFS
ncbi:glycosyl transferase [Pseudalgibacter alginicilyticus]|uniref:Glycosyl transferase n=1 Tax=Pseudalgibacter alginicilyticus TaxID=1736674 RepID=A0A0P0CVW7_9FLAO|nr:glycosyltransferase [Pseudalgibacter alginicilyticus]ALJ04579.1 glycosyl transferase [Pseudalgibacter alginicilyticus]